jgi:mRNA interferase MazF
VVALAAGAVVLVRFPFSDLSQVKLRPAVVLASAGRRDWILCQITSKNWGDPDAIPLEDSSFLTGSLRLASYVRPAKLFTANAELIFGNLGQLQPDFQKQIIDSVVIRLRTGGSPQNR